LFRLLEEALYEGKWLVCFSEDETAEATAPWLNYVRFLLEKCSTKTAHAAFRMWIVCKDSHAFLALSTLTAPVNCIDVEHLQKVKNRTFI
jgi:hypothetical protein